MSLKRIFLFLILYNIFLNSLVYAGSCMTVRGTTETISATCDNNLLIRNNGSHVTINSGVTVKDDEQAVKTATGATNTTIINNGTIKATDDEYGIYNQGIITTLENSGTITADRKTIENLSGSTITTIINSGTISATNGSGAIRNQGGTIGSITNSGTISSTAPSAIRNTNSSTITTLTNSGTISNTITNNANDEITTIINSGTISSTNKDTIINRGTIETLTNTGTINASGAGDFDITMGNNGIITTFNNLQGKLNSDPVTFENTLPTNYNIIVNSANDYGQIEFSSFAGKTNTIINFGVYSSSTLTEGTTYSSVIEGLGSSNITNTTGTFISGSVRNNWTLANSSGTTWDLVVDDVVNIAPDTNTSVINSTKTNVITGINNLLSVTEVNFAHMNTYDCDLFNGKNACLSLGGRHTKISNPTTSNSSFVLVGGYKINKNLRVAGFYHKNLLHKTPSTFQLRDKTPLYGALIVWNEEVDKSGYQIKFSNAYQLKSAILTRDVVGSSEKGIGYTEIEAQSYITELQYNYKASENSILIPYFAAKLSSVQQEGFTEVGLSSPLTFNRIKDSLGTIVSGLKFNINMSSSRILRGSAGVEYDLIHKVNKIEPTGINGLSTVSLVNEFNPMRPVLSLALDRYFSSNAKVTATFQYQELPYKSKAESNAYIYYTFGL